MIHNCMFWLVNGDFPRRIWHVHVYRSGIAYRLWPISASFWPLLEGNAYFYFIWTFITSPMWRLTNYIWSKSCFILEFPKTYIFMFSYMQHVYVTYHTNSKIVSVNPILSLCWCNGRWEELNAKKVDSTLETLLAVGGWNFGTERMTAMLATQANRWYILEIKYCKVWIWGFNMRV